MGTSVNGGGRRTAVNGGGRRTADGGWPPRVSFTRRRPRAQDPDELREGRLVLRTAGPAPRSAWGASQARTHHARAVGATGPAGPGTAAPKTSASVRAVKAQSPAPLAQQPAPRAVREPPREDKSQERLRRRPHSRPHARPSVPSTVLGQEHSVAHGRRTVGGTAARVS